MGKRYYKRGLNNTEKRQVKKLAVAAVKPMLECKHHDTIHTINVTNATFANDICDPVQAITDTGRIGDRITLKSVQISLRLAYTIPAMMRVMLVQWHDNTADNVINATDLFQFFGGATFDANTIMSPLNIDQSPKFTVLYDKKIAFNPAYSTSNTIKPKNVYINKRFRKNVQFNEAALSGSNKLYLCVFSDSATAGACNGYSRIRFYDG